MSGQKWATLNLCSTYFEHISFISHVGRNTQSVYVKRDRHFARRLFAHCHQWSISLGVGRSGLLCFVPWHAKFVQQAWAGLECFCCLNDDSNPWNTVWTVACCNEGGLICWLHSVPLESTCCLRTWLCRKCCVMSAARAVLIVIAQKHCSVCSIACTLHNAVGHAWLYLSAIHSIQIEQKMPMYGHQNRQAWPKAHSKLSLGFQQALF